LTSPGVLGRVLAPNTEEVILATTPLNKDRFESAGTAAPDLVEQRHLVLKLYRQLATAE